MSVYRIVKVKLEKHDMVEYSTERIRVYDLMHASSICDEADKSFPHYFLKHSYRYHDTYNDIRAVTWELYLDNKKVLTSEMFEDSEDAYSDMYQKFDEKILNTLKKIKRSKE